MNFKKFKTYWKYNRSRKFTKSFCYAPFNTLRFSATGQVQICCRNRYRTVGIIPELTIDEIWNGIEIESFRDNLKNYRLYDGCQFCEQMLNNHNFTFLKSLDYDYFQEKEEDKKIRKIEFEISNICNLECIMCSGELSSCIRKNKEQLPPIPSYYHDDFVYQLRPLWKDIKRATFAGGEPFLISLYYKIWDEIQHLNPSIENIIVTNGTILNEKIKALLERGNYYFAISIDSFKKEIYEKIRQRAVYEEVMKNFEYFYDYSMKKKRWITINVCPLIYNWQEIPEMINKMNKRNINVYFNQVDFPLNLSLRSFSSEKLAEIYHFYHSYRFESFDTSVAKQNLKQFEAFIKHIKYLISEIKTLENLNLDKIKTRSEAVELLIKHFKNKVSNFYNYQSIVYSSIIKIKHATEKIDDDEIFIRGVKNFCKEPDYIFVSEIVYTTEEKFVNKLRQTADIKDIN